MVGKTAKGSTAMETMKDRFDYGLDLKKCAAVSSYLCEPETAQRGQIQALRGMARRGQNTAISGTGKSGG